jgi:hypothetical protein
MLAMRHRHSASRVARALRPVLGFRLGPAPSIPSYDYEVHFDMASQWETTSEFLGGRRKAGSALRSIPALHRVEVNGRPSWKKRIALLTCLALTFTHVGQGLLCRGERH